MATMKIRGQTQILDYSISLQKLESPFISASTGNWDITAGNLDATITGIPNPVNDYDVVNKRYVDSLFASGIAWKEPVRVLSLSNVDITAAPVDIDGVTLSSGDRVALFGQTTPSEDGVYIFNGAGVAMTRADDWEVGEGAANWTFFVKEGSTYADTQWTVINNSGSDVIGTDDLTLIQISGQGTYTFQNALTNTAGVIEWGGSLTKNTTVDGGGTYSVSFGNLQNFGILTSFAYSLEVGDVATDYTAIYMQNTNLEIATNLSSGNYIGLYWDGSTTSPTFEDSQYNMGLQYAADYHTNWTDRSIVDKAYVDAKSKTIVVRALSTSNVDITAAPTDIDGVTLNNGDLVFLAGQTTSTEDGVYVFNGAGSAMTRAPYFESGVNILGFIVSVTDGTTNGDTVFMVSNDTSAVLGTDDIVLQTVGGAQTSLTFENGLTNNAGTVVLGGTLNQNTIIDLDNYNITYRVSTGNNYIGGLNVSYSSAYGAGIWNFDLNGFGGRLKQAADTYWLGMGLDAYNKVVRMGLADTYGVYPSDFNVVLGFDIDATNGFVVTDSVNSFGMKYDADYSANGMLDDRWIPDWGAVKSYVSGATSRYYNENHTITTAGTTQVTINNVPGTGQSVQNLVAYINGVRQAETTHYTVDTATGVVTFTDPLNVDDIVTFDYQIV